MKSNMKEKNPILIAVDQGNACFKTPHTIIPTHVYERLDDDVLDDGRRRIEYDGKTYVETSRMVPQCDNKANERFKTLTMVSMAEEIMVSGKRTKTIEEEVVLLIGVPNDKNFKLDDARELQRYYATPKILKYNYKNHHFSLIIKEVSVYRQAKAIMELIPINAGKVTIVDVGGQTTDVIHYDAESKDVIYSGMLDRSAGMKGLIRTVASRISTLGNKVRPEDVQEYLIENKGLNEDQIEKAKNYIVSWIETMFDSVSEEICEGLQVKKFGKIFLAGGGATVLEPYIREVLEEYGVQEGDIKVVQDAQTANARAYVQLKRKSMPATATKK